MNIVVITRGRVGKVHTLSSIPESWHSDTILCCPPEEGPHHRFPNQLHEPCPMDYSEKFQWILDGANGQLPNKVVIMDDDLRFSARNSAGTSLVAASTNDILDGLFSMKNLLDEHPLVGFHPRAMGNHAPGGYILNKRINAVQGINRELVGSVKVDHWPILADMVLNLTLLTRGQTNAVICDLFWDQVGTSNAPGGCSLHRTWDQQREAVLGLKALFPDFVTVKEKYVKDGWWGADKPRYDFVIQWKKAAEYGRLSNDQS